MKRAYADLPYGQVHYQSGGTGEALVLLHQTPLNSDEYAGLAPLLSRSFYVIAPDTPGYGKSDPPPTAEPDVKDYACFLHDFLTTLGITRAHFYGHHTGATLAAEMAVSYPRLASKLVISGYPYLDEKMRQDRINGPRYNPIKPVADGEHLSRFWDLLRPLNKSLESNQHFFLSYWLSGSHAEEGHHAVLRYKPEERLPLVRCPTLLISGDGDSFFKRLEATRSLIAGCRSTIIPGGRARLNLEMPETVARIVTDFLKE